MGDDEIVLPLRLRRRMWLVLDLSVGSVEALSFVVDSGSPVSLISSGVLSQLVERGVARPVHGRWYGLHDVHVGAIRVPDATVRAGGASDRLDVDGILGLDYFARFSRVCLDLPRLTLTLAPRAGAAGEA